MKDKTLVVLAAGMGSRFGGMKQIEPVGPNGEFIIDYSIYSAIKYGFNKVIFVIKEENYDVFKETIGKRIESKAEVKYAFQKLDDIPSGFNVPEGRVKPWGTAHAIYAARNYINGNFAVITGDDFYGDEAFKKLAESIDANTHVIVGYKVGDTLSINGAVKRGIIISDNGYVNKVIESSCTLGDNGVLCEPLDESLEKFEVSYDNPCSMLLNCFNKSILDTIANSMYEEFLNNKDNLLNYEVSLSDMMDLEIKNGNKIKVVNTNSHWIGMTYKEDKLELQKFINNEISNGIYPHNLWF